MKIAMLPVKDVSAAQAAESSYTVEYEEFVSAVRAAGKAKIDGVVVDNPTDEQLLQVTRSFRTRVFDLNHKINQHFNKQHSTQYLFKTSPSPCSSSSLCSCAKACLRA